MQSSKQEEITFPDSLFLCLACISLRQYRQKVSIRGFGKNRKRWGCHDWLQTNGKHDPQLFWNNDLRDSKTGY